MNVLIVEDELHTAKLLKEIIEENEAFLVVEILESIVDTVDYLIKQQNNLNLLFFDIQLADGQSFEIFKHVDVVTPIIFCTAYDEYTLQAIKNNGIDYILKPFKEEEIHHALNKYKKLISNLSAKAPFHFKPPKIEVYQQNFLTQFRDKTIIKRVGEVALFSVESETLYLYTYTGEKFPLFKKLEYIESVCNPNLFFRINRQMLVNRKAIISFEPYFKRKIILQLRINAQTKAIVSRLKVSSFKDWLEW